MNPTESSTETSTQSSPCMFCDFETVHKVVCKYSEAYKLNEKQNEALNEIVYSVVDTGQARKAPVSLVHGVFGSGKSFLIGILIILLQELAGMQNVELNIGIAAATNVAVDRILETLIDLDFHEFLRVGNLKKISKKILPYSLQLKSETQETRQMQETLKSKKLSEIERQNLQESLKTCKLKNREVLTKKNRVFGFTCLASSLDALSDCSIPLIIIDEACQHIEPMSLLCTRFGCKNLVLVGDPNQLPPTLSGNLEENGLKKTLFQRLINCGHKPIMLNRQYRVIIYNLKCHPLISNIANDLFYGNCLENSDLCESKKSLLPNIPNVAFVNISGKVFNINFRKSMTKNQCTMLLK